jgi:hypothetical protein
LDFNFFDPYFGTVGRRFNGVLHGWVNADQSPDAGRDEHTVILDLGDGRAGVCPTEPSLFSWWSREINERL